MSEPNNEGKRLGIIATLWLLASGVIGVGIWVGVQRADAIETQRRLNVIEEQTVRKEQLEDIKRRLENIEHKLDKLQEWELSHRH